MMMVETLNVGLRIKLPKKKKKKWTFKHGENLEFSIRLNWEFKIYMENEIDFYGDQWQMTLILIVQERSRDIFNNKEPLYALRQ